MSKCMELLAFATTALRNIHMGYPDKEIMAPSGMGLKTLLCDLVGYLRENRVDDEGGWECDATEGIEAKRLPVFEPFKLVVEAYATDEYGEGPSWAEVTVTPGFLQTLERLRRVCQDEKLESVTVPQGPDRWDLEDDLRIRGDSLRVWRDDFWFEAHPKHRDYSVETRSILIDHMIRVARKIASGDVENPLPDGFLIREGIVFYDGVRAADLASAYLDTEDAQDKPSAAELDESTTCADCGKATSLVIGCPDGAEVCSLCFDAGRH